MFYVKIPRNEIWLGNLWLKIGLIRDTIIGLKNTQR